MSEDACDKVGHSFIYALRASPCAENSPKLTADPDGHGDMFASRHSYWRDALAPGQALSSLTMDFLRFLEVEFANVERDLRKTPNQEEIG
jgi:hypothetical protein